MTRNEEGGIDLEPVEIEAVARQLCVDLIRGAAEGFIEWDEVPGLSERAWEAVAEQIGVLAERTAAYSKAHARMHDIDLAHLMEQLR